MRKVKVVKCWMWELGRDREQLVERGSGCKEHEGRIRILKNDYFFLENTQLSSPGAMHSKNNARTLPRPILLSLRSSRPTKRTSGSVSSFWLDTPGLEHNFVKQVPGKFSNFPGNLQGAAL
jgi:hypothetical protein